MENLSLFQAFFGWASIVGMVILVIVSIFLIGLRGWMIKIHKKFVDLPEELLNELYFKYIAYMKIAVYIFFIIPYLALWLMNQ